MPNQSYSEASAVCPYCSTAIPALSSLRPCAVCTAPGCRYCLASEGYARNRNGEFYQPLRATPLRHNRLPNGESVGGSRAGWCRPEEVAARQLGLFGEEAAS